MSRLYIDTEFNGFGGQLISMALVSDDAREWYEVLPLPASIEPWVAANVVPVLGRGPVSLSAFRASLREFLLQFDNPTIVADWYTDLVHFFGAMAGNDHTESFAYACRAELILVDEIDSVIPHNALADALAIRAHCERPGDSA